MKKNIRNLLILVIVFAALLTVFLILDSNNDPAATGVLYKIEDDGIKKIEINNEFGSYAFEKTGEEWMISSGEDTYRTNPEKMNLLISSLQSVPIDRVLDEKIAEYGFEQPRATVKVTDTKGNTYSFLVGAETASRANAYVYDLKTKKSMVTSTAAVSQLTGSLQAYRAKDVLTIDSTKIRRLAFYENEKLYMSVTNTDYKNWALEYPFEAPARKVILTEFVAKMRGWEVAGYPEQTQTKADMGLENPKTAMQITDANGNQQTIFFGKDDGTTTYVQIGENEIVKLYTVDVNLSTMTPEQVMYVAPLESNIGELKSISVTKDTPYVFTIDHSGSVPVITENGKDVSYQDFSGILTKYITLNATGYDPKQIDTSGKPVAVCTSVLTDGGTKELKLYPRDADTLYMLVDGKTEFYLNIADLDELLYRIEKASKSL
ncbi:MAG: DUF4340 domain-containing protein [Christensenellaceae bacterium]